MRVFVFRKGFYYHINDNFILLYDLMLGHLEFTLYLHQKKDLKIILMRKKPANI